MSDNQYITMNLSNTQKPMSDLQRLRKMSDVEIEEAINKDKDAAPILVKWPKNAKVVLPKKKIAVSLRVDSEVLEFYKKEGSGHLSLMNAVLRAYMISIRNHGLTRKKQ